MASIILTGANGSLGLHAAERLLKTHADFTLIFTVRDASDSDANTKSLQAIIARYPDAKASIHEVDFINLSAVHEFATKISSAITAGEYHRLKSIICNAAYWNLVRGPENTVDGYDKTLQVGHISHVALVLRLLGSFVDEGRIVLLSSVVQYRKTNSMTPYLPDLPEDLDQLNHGEEPEKDKQGRGFQRYAISKVVITTWMYALNRYLQNDPNLKNITVVAINPGNLGDSRVFGTNTPLSILLMQMLIMRPFMTVINRLSDPTFRSVAEAGIDVVELAVNKASPGERGYFTLLKKDESDPVTMDEKIQQKVWRKSLEWANITKENTALKDAFE